jgi:hypothetical protein
MNELEPERPYMGNEGKAGTFWRTFAVMLPALWAICLLAGLGATYYLLSVIGAALTALKYSRMGPPAIYRWSWMVPLAAAIVLVTIWARN